MFLLFYSLSVQMWASSNIVTGFLSIWMNPVVLFIHSAKLEASPFGRRHCRDGSWQKWPSLVLSWALQWNEPSSKCVSGKHAMETISITVHDHQFSCHSLLHNRFQWVSCISGNLPPVPSCVTDVKLHHKTKLTTKTLRSTSFSLQMHSTMDESSENLCR